MKYELVCILKEEISQKDSEDKIKNLLEKDGYGSADYLWWGKKTLAYEIKKQKTANYLSCTVVSKENKNPNSLIMKFKQDDTILRVLLLKKEEEK